MIKLDKIIHLTMKFSSKIVFPIIFLSSMFLISCRQYVSDKYYYFDNNGWTIDDTLRYDFRVNDLNSHYTMKINIKVNDDYKYRNLYFFTKTIMPDNTIKIDTLQFIVNSIDGKSYGHGLSANKELEFILNNSLKFNQSGKYLMEIQHGMRDNPLTGVHCVGFIITKNK